MLNKNKIRIAIIVDNPLRDLPSLVLLSYYLSKKGAVCYLVSSNIFSLNGGDEILNLSPDFVILNYIRPNNDKVVSKILRSGIKVGILETEGGVLVNVKEFVITGDKYIRESIDCFFSWGKTVSEYLINKQILAREKIFVTGSPRFDFYVDPLKRSAKNLSSWSDSSRPMVLINTNFPISNPEFQSIEQEISLYTDFLGFEKEEMLKNIEIEKVAIQQIADIARHLASNFPMIDFVMRPHPFEKMDTYKQLLGNHTNIFLIKKGAVDGWIINAKAVIQRSCSTAIESGLVNVPTFSPRWIKIPMEQPSAESVSIPCSNQDELNKMLAEVIDGHFIVPDYIKNNLDIVIEDWFYRIDGLSYQRVGDLVLSRCDISQRESIARNSAKSMKRNSVPPIKERMKRVFSYMTDFKRKIGIVDRMALSVLNILGLPEDWVILKGIRIRDFSWWDNTEKAFTHERVESILKEIDAVIGTGKDKPVAKTTTDETDYRYKFIGSKRSVVVNINNI